MKKFIIFTLLICTWICAHATHERAGEITYKHISGLTYEFTLTTYTYTASLADRPTIDIYWGDGTSNQVSRNSKTNIGNEIFQNIYITQHTFPASGSYIVSMEDQNRNQGIINIPNSVNIPFYVETIITINNFITPNNSPMLTNPPIDFGCVGIPYYHNPVAIDPDGDSLSYSLVACRGYNGDTIPGYTLPLASNSISIDAVTGDLYWDSPMVQGEYNIAILIEEFRMGVKISSMIRDMQIEITACDNYPPEISTLLDTCIDAGTLLSFHVTATDTSSQIITLSAMGDVFSQNNPATFPIAYGNGTVSSTFNWNTDCSNVRKQPYHVTFKAIDNGNVNLVKLFTTSITIVCPAPENLTATPFENAIALSWQPTPCDSFIKGYKIYRKVNPYGYIPDHCETGVPAYTGYKQIATTNSLTTTYIDENVKQANEYCYMVTAYFEDQGESYASNEACTILKNTLPLLTKNSIVSTDSQSGEIDIEWLAPKELDTIQYPGPYSYKLYGKSNQDQTFTLLQTFNGTDSLKYRHPLQNTEENYFSYYVEMLNLTNGETSIGTSDTATSVFLSIAVFDRNLLLSWTANTPWTNRQYIIYRYNEQTADFDSIAIVSDTCYLDMNLDYDSNYCYKILAMGYYPDSSIIAPLYNYSEIVCASPFDNQAPCCPIVEGNTDCKNIYLYWSIDTCTDSDIQQFNIYYKPNTNSQYKKIDSVDYNTSNYNLQNPVSVIGCFSVSALDSNGNESDICHEICFDTDICSRYRLPNIFTPNNDGINDLFMPYEYDFVKSIDITIFNRWGETVYKTTNPDINWDGTNMYTKAKCSDGVYYYACDVYEYTLTGIEKRILSGSITLVR